MLCFLEYKIDRDLVKICLANATENTNNYC